MPDGTMQVQRWMRETALTCRPGDGLHVPAGLMWDHDCGSVPVVGDDGRLVGIVTDRDICMAALLRGLPLHDITVDSVMQHDVQTCRPSDSIELVQARMAERQVRRIPVIDGANRPIGMVSIADLARMVARSGTAAPERMSALVHTFVSICAPRNVAVE